MGPRDGVELAKVLVKAAGLHRLHVYVVVVAVDQQVDLVELVDGRDALDGTGQEQAQPADLYGRVPDLKLLPIDLPSVAVDP